MEGRSLYQPINEILMHGTEHETMKEEDASVVTGSISEENKRTQNLISAVVLLAGLFIGSLFVDIGQLVSREGFSPRAVRESTILEAAGKTWVGYTDPKVKVTVLTDQSCEKCAPDEALVWLRRILPTMEASPLEVSSDEGKAMVEKFGVTTLPAFVFSDKISSTNFYSIAGEIFKEKGGSYILDTARLGLTPGKYLSLPQVGDDAIVLGSRDAKVKVIEYSDFQCPYCKVFSSSVTKMIAEYGDRVAFVYKHLPLSFHPQAENTALASECANEQGKFKPYHDLLFAKQDVWSKTEGTKVFKGYAKQLGLKTAEFDSCLDNKKYAEKVAADAEEASKFGISGTPGIFVGDTFFAGAISYDELKASLDAALRTE